MFLKNSSHKEKKTISITISHPSMKFETIKGVDLDAIDKKIVKKKKIIIKNINIFFFKKVFCKITTFLTILTNLNNSGGNPTSHSQNNPSKIFDSPFQPTR